MPAERNTSAPTTTPKPKRRQLTDPVLRRARLRVQLVLAAFIFTMIAALFANLHMTTRLAARYTPMLDAILHVKLNVTTAHLWFEELLAGDTGESIGEVWGNMSAADLHIVNVLKGDRVDNLTLGGIVPEEHFRGAFEALGRKLGALRRVAELRWEQAGSGAAGSELDALYDAQFRDIIAQADEIEIDLETVIGRDLQRFQHLQAGLIGACLLLLVFGVWFTSGQITRLGSEVEQRRATERQLRHSQAMALAARDEARAASRAKDLFLAKISHEIRTPISAVAGMSNLLADTALSPDQAEHLRHIETSTHDLMQMVDDLLDYSRIAAGRLALYPSAFDLRRLLADLGDIIAGQAADKDIAFDLDLPADFPRLVLGDPVRLRQVVLNLLRNSLKFTERGKLLLALEGSFRDGGAAVDAEIRVRDTGIGIPRDKIAHIFEPFGQADESTTRLYGGTGLGLTIGRELVELMGGTIEVESMPGSGTEFRIRLPLPLAVGEAAPEAVPEAGMRVLVVDLADSLRERTHALITGLGLEVEEASDGEDALQAARSAAAADWPFGAVVVSDRIGNPPLEEFLGRWSAETQLPPARLLVVADRYTSRLAQRYRMLGAERCMSRAQKAIDLPSALAGAAPPGPAREEGVQRSFDAHVLLVDDHPVNQIAARHMLELLGCQVDTALSGAEALQLWRAHDYDLVFLDWQMPHMDGLEVTRTMRNEERQQGAPPVPIVAMTANVSAEDRRRCIEAGMDEHLGKPVNREELTNVLERFCTDRARTGT